MYAHSTSFAFFLLGIRNVFFGKNLISIIFIILSILSHSIGIAFALIYLISYFLNSDKYFAKNNIIFYIFFSLIIIFFYKFNIQLTNFEVKNDNIYNSFLEDYTIFELIKFKLFELKKHLETVPSFSSFGIYFTSLIVLYALTNNKNVIHNQKNLFTICIALVVVILVALFSSATLVIVKRLQPIIMLIIYISTFCLFLICLKTLFNFIKKNQIKNFKIKKFNSIKFELFKLFAVIIFFTFFLVFFRIEFLKPDGIKLIQYMKNLDDSNYNKNNIKKLISNSSNNSVYLIDGSEATLYFHILNGLYNYKFYWSHIYNSDQQIEIINQSDFLVFENNISFSGRKKGIEHQWSNQLFINKDFNLIIENVKNQNLIVNFISPYKNAIVSAGSKSKKDYIIKEGMNTVKIKLENSDKKLKLSSNKKLLISSIKISEDQTTNWPWNTELTINKKNSISKKIDKINFKVNEFLNNKYNCSNFDLLHDDDLFIYFKVNC